MAAGLLALAGRAAEIWVAPDGDDGNPGTRDRPVASPAQALRLARELRRTSTVPPAGGIHLLLRGGTYPLREGWQLRPADSGTEASPTVIEAAPGERPVLSGGMRVGPWRRPLEPIPGLPAAAQDQVWIADAPRIDGWPVICRQLWVGEHKAIRARTPNDDAMARLQGWDRAAEVATIPAATLAGAETPDGVEMVLEQQWEIAILRVAGWQMAGAAARITFRQPESRIEFEHPWPQPILPPAGGGAFYLVGSIGFLDQPGEWCQTTPDGRIVYWPRAGEDPARASATVPARETVLRIEGTRDHPVRYVQFRGIGFEHAAWRRPAVAGHVPLQVGMDLREAYKLKPPGTAEKAALENQAWIGRLPAGVTVANAADIVFARCRFEHLAASALDLTTGVHDSRVEGCVFADVGGNGIQLGSFQTGAVETHVPYNPSDGREVCVRVRLADNRVTNCGTEDWGCVGIAIGYAREVDVEHNEICDLPYTGISIGWGWTPAATCLRANRIHANSVHDVARRLCDTAAIYTLSAQPGTVVSENAIGPITMSPYVDRPNHWFYLYADEGSSGITFRDNWCPAERFLKNANGPGNVWADNGPTVATRIRESAGLEVGFRALSTPEPGGDGATSRGP